VFGATPWIPKVHFHNPFLAIENGDDFLRPFHLAAKGELAPFIPVVEGSIPNENNKGEGMKQEATERVLVALRRILSGEIYVSDRIANSMVRHYVRGANASAHSSISDLTDRELEVFRLIGEVWERARSRRRCTSV
jgi:hypothetical protein